MKAFLIDPKQGTITEVQHDDTLQDIYKHIGADCIDAIRINEHGDTIYVDDEGLYRQDHFFKYKSFVHPIAGSGLVLGADREGYSVDPVIGLEELRNNVTFISYGVAVMMAKAAEAIARQQQKEHPGFEHIIVSGADILEDREYTDSSE
jgi:hypothetical protein